MASSLGAPDQGEQLLVVGVVIIRKIENTGAVLLRLVEDPLESSGEVRCKCVEQTCRGFTCFCWRLLWVSSLTAVICVLDSLGQEDALKEENMNYHKKI